MPKRRTPEELLELADDVVNEYAERDELFDDLDSYYFQEAAKDVDADAEDEGVEIVRLPHASTAADVVQDLVAAVQVNLAVPAMSEKSGDKRLAETAEGFLKALIHESEQAQGVRLPAQASWCAFMHGCCAGRVVPKPSYVSKVNGVWQVKDRIPLQMQLRDPRIVYPRFGQDGMQCVIERWTRTVHDIQRTYGAEILPTRKLTDEVEWTEWWDDAEHCYWADAEPVPMPGGKKPGPRVHLYGGNPYVFIFARQTGRVREPDKRVRPILANMRRVIDRMDRMDSMEATALAQYNGDALLVWRRGAATADPDAEERDWQIDMRPGRQNYMDVDDKVEWLRSTMRSPDFAAARGKYEAMWERGTFPSTMYGTDPGRAMAAYAIHLLNQSGQLRLKPILACIEDFIGALCERALMVAENYVAPLVEGPIPFVTFAQVEEADGRRRGVRNREGFDAAKVAGAYNVGVTLGELLPQDEQTNLTLAERAVGGHLLSWETSVEKWKLTDSPAQERARLDREAAWQDPEVVALKRAILVASVKQELREDAVKLGIDVDKVLASPPEAQAASPQPPVPMGGGGAVGPGGLPPEAVAAMLGGGQPGGMGPGVVPLEAGMPVPQGVPAELMPGLGPAAAGPGMTEPVMEPGVAPMGGGQPGLRAGAPQGMAGLPPELIAAVQAGELSPEDAMMVWQQVQAQAGSVPPGGMGGV